MIDGESIPTRHLAVVDIRVLEDGFKGVANALVVPFVIEKRPDDGGLGQCVEGAQQLDCVTTPGEPSLRSKTEIY